MTGILNRKRNQLLPKTSLRILCLQVNAGSNPQKNLDRVFGRLDRLRGRFDLIALPENFCWRGTSKDLSQISERFSSVLKRFQAYARKRQSAILLGSLIEPSAKKNKFWNTSVLISPQGKIAARYRKIHLFDIGMKQVQVQESAHILSGHSIVTGRVGKIKAGLTICYDLRFPELYRQLSLRGTKIIFVPSNFTYQTGKAHWEILLKARAIENQVFIVAPAQAGKNPASGIRSFGTSLILDPWGNVLARAGRSREESIFASLDMKKLDQLRKTFPVLKHRRLLS
ncbi:MAG: carbon-nitrogen hydrolase family protein [Candidatus Omnitrophica bacterium]|nr:carbon-nitrogen hydrolase family protein [Candidatus Omnitrophota bacterium]